MSSKRDRIARLVYWKNKKTKFNAIVSASKEGSNGRGGHVYIASLGDGLYKIGRTTNLARRQNELSASNIICKIVYSLYFTDCGIAEKTIHRELRKCRKTREIFSLDHNTLEHAKTELCKIQRILQQVS